MHDGHVGGRKQYNDFRLGNIFYFYANMFYCFSPPTWPPCTHSIGHFSNASQWRFLRGYLQRFQRLTWLVERKKERGTEQCSSPTKNAAAGNKSPVKIQLLGAGLLVLNHQLLDDKNVVGSAR